MASSAAILAFAQRGPLFRRLGADAPPAAEWLRHGNALAAQLVPGVDVLAHDPTTAARIFHLYLPIYFWCKSFVDVKQQQQRQRQHAIPSSTESKAIGIGLSAVQGCGKTTLVEFLTDRFAADGLVCAAVSFDDFYLTGADQDAVAAAHPDNPLLQVRGNAGTHDLTLGTEILTRMLRREVGVNVPRYDKSARGGRGDRAPVAEWTRLERAPDVVLLEGWMAGFTPVAASELGVRIGSKMTDGETASAAAPESAASNEFSVISASSHPAFEKGIDDVNRMLSKYSAWHDCMSAWVVVSIDEHAHVYRWCLEAERAMAARGKPGMSDEQIHDFVSRYMPAYRTYLPGLYAAAEDGGPGVCGCPTLRVEVDGERQVVADQ